jgi:predicted acylesterase/phospholipase RssA
VLAQSLAIGKDPLMEMGADTPPALDLLRSARRVGLVFSGGASRCAFQVGVIETLTELGFRPELCVAVSGGVWNAAAISADTVPRLRHYWRAFVRMPRFDVRNLLRDHSPYRFPEMHRRTFSRYVGVERLRRPGAPALWVGVTRLRDRQGAFFDARKVDDPLALCLASNYVPPFYTHAPRIDGERYGDGGLTNNLPYEKAFAEGCDAVVLVTMKGESEGGLYRNAREPDHVIPAPFRERTVVIRPRHRLPCAWAENRWEVLRTVIDLGRLRAREVLLGERHPETEARAQLGALDLFLRRLMMTRVLAASTRRRKPL